MAEPTRGPCCIPTDQNNSLTANIQAISALEQCLFPFNRPTRNFRNGFSFIRVAYNKRPTNKRCKTYSTPILPVHTCMHSNGYIISMTLISSTFAERKEQRGKNFPSIPSTLTQCAALRKEMSILNYSSVSSLSSRCQATVMQTCVFHTVRKIFLCKAVSLISRCSPN